MFEDPAEEPEDYDHEAKQTTGSTAGLSTDTRPSSLHTPDNDVPAPPLRDSPMTLLSLEASIGVS